MPNNKTKMRKSALSRTNKIRADLLAHLIPGYAGVKYGMKIGTALRRKYEAFKKAHRTGKRGSPYLRGFEEHRQ